MAKTTVAKGPEITAENATEPVDHHNEEVSQSATLVLRKNWFAPREEIFDP